MPTGFMWLTLGAGGDKVSDVDDTDPPDWGRRIIGTEW